MSDIPECKFFKQTLNKAMVFGECFMKRELGNEKRIKFWSQNRGYGFLKNELPNLYREAKDPDITVQQILQTPNLSELFLTVSSLHLRFYARQFTSKPVTSYTII